MHPTTSRLLSRHCFHSLPLVACNITEDLHWQPAAIENIAIPKTRSLCRDFNRFKPLAPTKLCALPSAAKRSGGGSNPAKAINQLW
jgi:hypothetical protein